MIFWSGILVIRFHFDFLFVYPDLTGRLNSYFGEMQYQELIFYWFLTFDVTSFFKSKLVAFIEMMLCKHKSRTNGRERLASVKYICGSFKEVVILVCQITFKMKRMPSCCSLDLFTIPLKTRVANLSGMVRKLRNFIKKSGKCLEN